MVLLELIGSHIHTGQCEAGVNNFLGLVHCGIEPYRGGVSSPCTTETERSSLVLDGTVVEYIAELVAGVGIRSCDDIGTGLSVGRAALVDEGATVVVNVATTAEVVNSTVNLRILPVELAVRIAVVGILIREHLHILADGLLTLVLQADCTSATQTSLNGSVVVERVLQRQVLHVQTSTCVQQGSSCADTLDADVRSILNNDSVHRLTNQRDVIAADGCQYGLFQIVSTIRQEDNLTIRAAEAIGQLKHREQVLTAFNIVGATLYNIDVTAFCDIRILSLIADADAVDVADSRNLQCQNACTLCTIVLNGSIGTVGRNLIVGSAKNGSTVRSVQGQIACR